MSNEKTVEITYGIDMGETSGDVTALAIIDGKTVYNFIDEEAEVIIKLLAQERAKAEDAGFIEGQRVGQYQAADKLYHHTTTMWLFKDDLLNIKADIPSRIQEMNKDCEKFLNHNAKIYKAYVHGDRYKRMHTAELKAKEVESNG